MHKVALEKAKELKLNVKYECKVPGVFDMPLVIDTLLQKKEIDAVVTLGAIIKGKLSMMKSLQMLLQQEFPNYQLNIKSQFPWEFPVQECLKDRHLQELDRYQKGQLS